MRGAFHEGELEVQQKLGVLDRARRISDSIAPNLPLAAGNWLSARPTIFIAAEDSNEILWCSVRVAKPGFIQNPDIYTLSIMNSALEGDPLTDEELDQKNVGSIILEPDQCRRFRINGKAKKLEVGFEIAIEQAYMNCPKYIQQRLIEFDTEFKPAPEFIKADSLSADQKNLIETSDTFLIATTHLEGGADCSHRGGSPGFIKVINSSELIFPDYKGNNMFQTFGNITRDPRTALLFLDFKNRSILQLSGRAEILWDTPEKEKFPGAQRMVSLQIDQVRYSKNILPLKQTFLQYNKHNPKIINSKK